MKKKGRNSVPSLVSHIWSLDCLIQAQIVLCTTSPVQYKCIGQEIYKPEEQSLSRSELESPGSFAILSTKELSIVCSYSEETKAFLANQHVNISLELVTLSAKKWYSLFTLQNQIIEDPGLEPVYHMSQLDYFFGFVFILLRQVTGEVKFSGLYEALCYISHFTCVALSAWSKEGRWQKEVTDLV